MVGVGSRRLRQKQGEGVRPLGQGGQTPFHRGPRQPHGCRQRAKCDFSSVTAKEQLHLHSPDIMSTL